MYTAAGGKKIANEGEKDITMVTGETSRETECFSVLQVESSTKLRVSRTMSTSSTCVHRAPRGVLDGRDESLVSC